ncbi:MAG: hypothetical protein Q8R28_05810, partial [Dehalococcoidia bacterium]|nr:hypothetical protein [Dehalococcoidia bacterium]
PRPIPPVFEERHPMRREEEREMEDAIAAGNMEEAVLEAADLLWVVLGDLETFGEAGYGAADTVARKNAAKTIHTHAIAPSGKLLPLDDAHRHKWAGMEEARERAREWTARWMLPRMPDE